MYSQIIMNNFLNVTLSSICLFVRPDEHFGLIYNVRDMLPYPLMSKIIYDVSCVNISNYSAMFRRYEF